MSGDITRRDFLAGGTAVSLAGILSPSLAEGVRPRADMFSEFDYGAVKLTGGSLKQQYDRIRDSYIALDNDRLLKVYRERAGLPAPGAEMGGWYAANGFVPGHSLGQYISGLARIGRATGDSACISKAGELVEGFLATLGRKDRIYAGPNAETVWPCYILDKHLAGLIDAFSLAGVAQARDLIPRVFKGALPYIPERGRDRIGKKDPPYDETYILPENLFSAYELTGDRELYNRAIAYLLDREFFDPLARGEDVLPGRHAYSHAIALSSAGKACRVLGEDRYLRTTVNAWQFLETVQQYASGGWGPNETFIEPHKGQLFESLRSTVDHFETPCGSYAAIKLARYLLCATGDGRYGDGLERVAWNCLLAVKEPDGDGDYPYYSTYSANAEKVYYRQKWPCCSGTLIQGVADYVRDIYFRSNDGVAVNLYTPSQVQWRHGGAKVTLTQDTTYPLGHTIHLHINSMEPVFFTLRVRIPGWLQQSPSLQVNGAATSFTIRRGFASLRRTWRNGDRVTLELPQDFRTESIDDLHQDTVAMLRGPLLYVQTNPGTGAEKLPPLDTFRHNDDSPGTYCAQNRTFVPIYFVRNERYTTYFEKG